MQKIIFSAMAVLLLAACSNNSYQKTKSGLLYNVVKKGSGPKVKYGQILKVHFSQKAGDSMIVSSFDNGLPVYARVDSVGPVYNVLEVLPMVHKGDSIVIIEMGDSLQKRGQLPPYMKPSQKRTWTLKIAEIYDNTEKVEADRSAETQRYQKSQDAVFEKYIESKKANLQKTANGVYVDVKEVGNGPATDTGKTVLVKYTGKFLPSEKVFESTMTTPGAQPIPVALGKGGVIPGWEEALKLFHKGGKGTLYIPYQMAYNERPGPNGMPYQNLIFDIEIVDVQNPPSTPTVADTTVKAKK